MKIQAIKSIRQNGIKKVMKYHTGIINELYLSFLLYMYFHITQMDIRSVKYSQKLIEIFHKFKNITETLFMATVLIIALLSFPKLITRALDKEADAKEAVLIEHKAFLKKSLPSDNAY